MSESTNGARVDPDRRAELLAGAALGDLDAVEQAELDTLAAADPTVGAELAELLDTVAVLPPAGSGWDDVEPSASLDASMAALAGATREASAPVPPEPAAHRPADELASRRERRGGVARRLVAVAASVALVGGGALGGVAVDRYQSRDVTGPPGTLGALEQVDFAAPAGVVVDASVVAHTWGTESRMSVAGLPVGDTYTLVLVDADGNELLSGAFLGAEKPVVCRMNAAVLRPDVVSVQLRDSAGATVLDAELPPAEAAVALG